MITIRPHREGDENAIRRLFAECFGKELSHDEWIWKYRHPYPRSSAFVAEEDGRIVAHYGGFRLSFYSEGKVFHAYQGCDVMTHPKSRARLFSKKGIIVQTAGKFFDAHPMEFIFGFPSERHGRLQKLQLGFAPHRHIKVMKKEKRYFRAGKGLFARVRKGWGSIFPEEMDRMWEKTKDALPLSIEKRSDYILWRYKDNPRGGYEVMTVRGFLGRNLKAYAVFRETEDAVHVLDFFVSDPNYFQKFLVILENMAMESGTKLVSFWCNPVESYFKELRVGGYSEEQGIPYIVKAFEGSGVSADFFLDHYCFRQGDYDAA